MSKRKIVLSSDSDDEMPPKPQKKKTNISPVKSHKKKSKTNDESDIDITPQKASSSKKKSRTEPEDSDIEMLSDEDQLILGSDDKKKKRGKKELLPGQKTLNFTSSATSSNKEKDKKNPTVSHVNPADFFKSVPRPAKQKKEPEMKKTTPKKIETESPVKKVSPSQKENAKVKKDDDEFADSDDSFDTFVPISKKKTPSPAKKESPMKPKLEDKKSKVEKEKIVTKKTTKEPEPEKKVPSMAKLVSKPSATSSQDSGYSSQEIVKPKQDDEKYLQWVDKYKPKNLTQLVGQHGDKSPMNKLMDWLKDWAKHNLGEGAKIKKPKPAPWMASQDGTAFKAALLSGSPGVGKTTCAYMACQNMGFQLVEMNASDVRNKKHLEAKVGELSGSHQIDQFFGKKVAVPQDNLKVHHVLIMDEVDGMSGNEDRAGISELIQIIKGSKIPIICICNDRQHTKIRSLANYCYDLRFPKPRVEQIRSRMMTICATEKLKISKDELDQIIELSAHDVRQTIYNLQMRSKSTNGNIAKKDVTWGPFEAARRLLDSRTTLREKQEMFFVDYGIMPLFVQENYVNMRNDKHTPVQAIHGLRKASELISLGDNIDRHIRSGGAWKLLNEQSMISAALPAIATDGHLKAMIQFPAWLGKNSTAGKRRRLLQQLVMHSHLKVSANMYSFATDYAPILRTKITKPLLIRESDGIDEVIETMTEYDLIKDDSEALSEIVVWPGKIDPASKILTKVKSALTRTLNKTARMLPYSMDEISKGKKRGVNSVGIEMDEEGNLVEKFEDEDDDEEDEKPSSSEVVVKVTSGSTGRGGAKASTRGATSGRGSRGGRGRGAKK